MTLWRQRGAPATATTFIRNPFRKSRSMTRRFRFRFPRPRVMLGIAAAVVALVVGMELRPEPRGVRTPPPPGSVMADQFAVTLLGCQDDPRGSEQAARSFICSLQILNTMPERYHVAIYEIALQKDGRVLASRPSEFHTNVPSAGVIRPTVRLGPIDRAHQPERLQVVVRLEPRVEHRVVLPFAWGGPKKLPLIPFDLGS